jgi:hypothetical protein
VHGRFVGTGGLANEGLIAEAAAAAEGTVLMTYFNDEVDAQALAWAERYRREYASGAQPPRPVLAAWEYRAIHGIVAPCLQRAGTDRIRLRDCLRQWRAVDPAACGGGDPRRRVPSARRCAMRLALRQPARHRGARGHGIGSSCG